MENLPVYTGPNRRLVIAIDIGTTHSGISYSILEPGRRPEINAITSFPGQEHGNLTTASKIPSIIYYSSNPTFTPRAIGSEALSPSTIQIAEAEGWVKVERFKLHLLPYLPSPTASPQPSTPHELLTLPPLPSGLTIERIYADFISYLHTCTASYIRTSHPNGEALWRSLWDSGDVEYVFSHPSGWEGFQRQVVRRAAIDAGLLGQRGGGVDYADGHSGDGDGEDGEGEEEARERITFITEGEASLHYAILNGLPEGALKNGQGIIIVDAGGGTIDLSAYAQRGVGNFEEIALPQCHLQGSLSVTSQARSYLQKHLASSPFLPSLPHILARFDASTKPRFRSPVEAQYIKFGGTRDNDPERGIRFGQLKLSGEVVKGFFEGSVRCVVRAVEGVVREARRRRVTHVVMVGGLAANDYLFAQIASALEPQGLTVVRPGDNHTNQCVPTGAIIARLTASHRVRTRIAGLTYGHFCSVRYNALDPDHSARLGTPDVFVAYSGERRVGGWFDVILAKGTQVSEATEFRQAYTLKSRSRAFFDDITYELHCYRGSTDPCPEWRDEEPENFAPLCTIQMDFSHLDLELREGGYYELEYALVLKLGLAELEARVAWMEDGVEKQSPAKIVYDPCF